MNFATSPRSLFEQEGILFYPGLLDGSELDHLRRVCERIMSSFLRQSAASDVVNMRHLNDPRWCEHPRDWQAIMELVADPRCLGPVEQIFRGRSLFRCTTLWVNPRETSRDGDWHRDDQFMLPDEKAVQEHLESPTAGQPAGVQFQIALVDNDDVEYVPFSAGRYDSPLEHYFRCADDRAHSREPGMPNAMRVPLRAGDATIFNPSGLHRGRYHTDKPRCTLMLTYTPLSAPCWDSFSLQPWMLEPGHLDTLSPRARVYFEEFIDTYRAYWLSGGSPSVPPASPPAIPSSTT